MKQKILNQRLLSSCPTNEVEENTTILHGISKIHDHFIRMDRMKNHLNTNDEIDELDKLFIIIDRRKTNLHHIRLHVVLFLHVVILQKLRHGLIKALLILFFIQIICSTITIKLHVCDLLIHIIRINFCLTSIERIIAYIRDRRIIEILQRSIHLSLIRFKQSFRELFREVESKNLTS